MTGGPWQGPLCRPATAAVASAIRAAETSEVPTRRWLDSRLAVVAEDLAYLLLAILPAQRLGAEVDEGWAWLRAEAETVEGIRRWLVAA